ncbi:MAG: VWA domain-containing protein [Muribaculaceae bacterium]|nr:VWA domain-containing protein [Muribaculaceae bacterium]
MFTFAYPGLLFLLLLIPLVAGLFILSQLVRKKRLKKFGNPQSLQSLMGDLSHYKPVVRLCVALVGLAAIIFALARPWGGVKNQETSREGIEIVIAVDASNSMRASSTGDENGPERMKTSKLILEKLINRLNNDRVGLIAYAGDAYTLIPVTNDYVSAKAFLNSIDPSLIPHQGTNIGAAISLAQRSFSDKGDVGKAIILLTDAEELENQEGVIREVKQASKRGIQTDVIGIGSVPVTIPDDHQGRMIEEETGEVVRSALNEDLALEIAKAGKGIYVNASNDDAIDELSKQLGSLKKSALESSFLVTHDELYFPFVILAIVILIIDFIITDKRNRWLDKISFFSKEAKLVGLIMILGVTLGACKKDKTPDVEPGRQQEFASRRDSLLSHFSLPKERDLIIRGNEAFYAGDTEMADSNFNAALGVNPRSVVANLNRGLNTLQQIVMMEQATQEGQLPDSVMGPLLQKATEALSQASAPKVEKQNASSLAFYNSGNVSFTQKKYDEAIGQYKEALRLNPADDHARRNLRIAQLQKDENDKNQQQQQQQQDQNQDQQQQEQQQDRQQINQQTSQQILDAAERKENIRRVKMQTDRQESTDKSGRSQKKW